MEWKLAPQIKQLARDGSGINVSEKIVANSIINECRLPFLPNGKYHNIILPKKMETSQRTNSYCLDILQIVGESQCVLSDGAHKGYSQLQCRCVEQNGTPCGQFIQNFCSQSCCNISVACTNNRSLRITNNDTMRKVPQDVIRSKSSQKKCNVFQLDGRETTNLLLI
ncbi:MAG: hypothetical protein EZS28_034297 [Streblomastix strix]|uniref:Uncharacterized protein n=1 Tax=Streblomastix strix TaxID=222440 RepID=A0A5J4UH96_9EUKA|nr:MAG: hypothetical protein EZS28_034297 [Streblomastix strix]